jgi:hypothetical protein
MTERTEQPHLGGGISGDSDGPGDEPKNLSAEVADRVDRWIAQPASIWQPGSPAAVEVANGEVRQDGTPWGDRTVRTTYA